jgi:hypothetical protein
VALAAVRGLHEQVLQVEARLDDERGVVVEKQREADDLAGLLGQQGLGVGPRAEQVLVQEALVEGDCVGEALVLGQRADQAGDNGRVLPGRGSNHRTCLR